jgi:hypothetical protein
MYAQPDPVKIIAAKLPYAPKSWMLELKLVWSVCWISNIQAATADSEMSDGIMNT